MSYEALIAKQTKRLANKRARKFAQKGRSDLEELMARGLLPSQALAVWAGTVQNQTDNQRNDGKSDR